MPGSAKSWVTDGPVVVTSGMSSPKRHRKVQPSAAGTSVPVKDTVATRPDPAQPLTSARRSRTSGQSQAGVVTSARRVIGAHGLPDGGTSVTDAAAGPGIEKRLKTGTGSDLVCGSPSLNVQT